MDPSSPAFIELASGDYVGNWARRTAWPLQMAQKPWNFRTHMRPRCARMCDPNLNCYEHLGRLGCRLHLRHSLLFRAGPSRRI